MQNQRRKQEKRRRSQKKNVVVVVDFDKQRLPNNVYNNIIVPFGYSQLIKWMWFSFNKKILWRQEWDANCIREECFFFSFVYLHWYAIYYDYYYSLSIFDISRYVLERTSFEYWFRWTAFTKNKARKFMKKRGWGLKVILSSRKIRTWVWYAANQPFVIGQF